MNGELGTTQPAWRTALEALAPVVRAASARAEREHGFTPDVVEGLIHHALFRSWIPRSLGGSELDVPESLLFLEEAAHIDGAFGWAVMTGTTRGLFAGMMEPAFAREVFGPRDAVVASGDSPGGRATRRVEDYTVTGRWPNASGAQYATWFVAARAICDDSGNTRAMAFPRRDVEIRRSWEAFGLCATSTYEFSVTDVTVPAARTFDILATPVERGPLYRFPLAAHAEFCVAILSLGIARHGLSEFLELADSRVNTYGDGPISRADATRRRIADVTATLHALRESLLARADSAWDRVAAGGTLTVEEQTEITHTCIAAAEGAVRALDLLFPLAGMAALFVESAFGRCWRDARTTAQHGVVSPLRG